MSHPYRTAPAYARWSRAVAEPAPADVDPVVGFPYRITRKDRIVTAGSCFAQHIARYLKNAGFNHFVTEPGHPILIQPIKDKHNYGVFSARYGNIYTSRQLRQLFERVRGTFSPEEDIWPGANGGFVDPYRPTVQPGGFATVEELHTDRRTHLRAVKRAMRRADVFVFTLGLTETWVSKADGAAFPLCPGVEGGTFDPDRHAFVNLTTDEVVEDMTAAIRMLRRMSPNVRVVLTVSPVPLAATAVDRHVLVSTVLSKSVLRVAADILTRELTDVTYFPSYEIITGPFSRGAYYASDLRSVTDAGVDHVMRLFFEHATEGARARARPSIERDGAAAFRAKLEAVTEAICEEALLDRA